MGTKMEEAGELQVKLLQGNAVIPVQGSAGAASYDLCAVSSCIIPSQSKGTIETRLAVSLPPGTYAWIAPHSGLAIHILLMLEWVIWSPWLCIGGIRVGH